MGPRPHLVLRSRRAPASPTSLNCSCALPAWKNCRISSRRAMAGFCRNAGMPPEAAAVVLLPPPLLPLLPAAGGSGPVAAAARTSRRRGDRDIISQTLGSCRALGARLKKVIPARAFCAACRKVTQASDELMRAQLGTSRQKQYEDALPPLPALNAPPAARRAPAALQAPQLALMSVTSLCIDSQHETELYEQLSKVLRAPGTRGFPVPPGGPWWQFGRNPSCAATRQWTARTRNGKRDMDG